MAFLRPSRTFTVFFSSPLACNIIIPRQCQRFGSKSSPLKRQSDLRTHTRLQALNSRLPRFLQRYTTPLLNAPLTHVTSFLILHEITAIAPLFALVGLFHYSEWIPSFLVKEDGEGDSAESAFDEGVRKFGKWLRKRGWVDEDEIPGEAGKDLGDKNTRNDQVHGQVSSRGTGLIFHFAAAYAITKALLPVRIAASAWATPWFARSVLVPVRNFANRLFRKGRKQ